MNGLLWNILRWSVLTFLVSSMLELGLSLTLAQVLAPLRNVRLITLAIVANFLIVPLLALGVAKAMRLEEPFATGLLLLGLAPGAPFIPKVVQIARGHLAFATGLMVLLVVGTAIDLPLLLPRVITGVEINAWQIEQSLFLAMLLPLFVGLVVHAKFRSLPAWLCSSMGLVANVSALVVLVLIVAFNFQSVVRLFGTGVIFAGLIFVLLSVLIGWLFGGHDREIRCALGLGTGLRNVGAALFIGTKNFDDARVNVMVIVTALLGLFILLPAASAFGRRTRIATSSRLDSRTSPPAMH
jgi:bile acid:Na+ symporter, BASS family